MLCLFLVCVCLSVRPLTQAGEEERVDSTKEVPKKERWALAAAERCTAVRAGTTGTSRGPHRARSLIISLSGLHYTIYLKQYIRVFPTIALFVQA